LLVEAGAGTGKTAVLVERFLHLLERHPDWPVDSIVAVTFTEKATREMRSRIREGVEKEAAAAGPGSQWQVRRRALDRLAVSTIHGLCARILRENSIAAGIDPRFTVLEEQDTALLREQAVRQALANLAAGVRPEGSEEHDPFDLLADFETRDLHEQMMRLLSQRGTVDRLFARLPDPHELLEGWRAQVAAMCREIWDEQMALHDEMCVALEQLPALRITNPADKLAEHVLSAQEGCACAQDGDLAGAAACFARIRLNVGSAAGWGGRDGLSEVKGWLRQVRDLGACLSAKGCDKPVGPEDERAADALQCWRVLWNYVSGIYDRLKQELAAVDFDDLERLAWRLLTEQPRDDHARDERVQATIDGINHLMVDEFQDVNEVQGEILTALAELGAGGKFFAVGDAKQSIYRFRQAQVKVFNGTAREILRRTGHGPLPLNRSFRGRRSSLAKQPRAAWTYLPCLRELLTRPAGWKRESSPAGCTNWSPGG
jgi:ATP-dependent helicase/nuclease subunit A